MGLMMKNCNNFGVHWEIRFLGGGEGRGVLMKNQYRGGNCLKEGEWGAWALCRFKGGGQERGGLIP